MGLFDSLKEGLNRSRQSFREQMNMILEREPEVDDSFWDDLTEALIGADIGVHAADATVEQLRLDSIRKGLPNASAVLDMLSDTLAGQFTTTNEDPFAEVPRVILFVGVNGSGKTTTVGKIAAEYTMKGRSVLLGSGDTFRAAAIEQLEVWAKRSNVNIVQRERGADPASVCYETIEEAERANIDLALIDTAGRLHTSDDLMRELQKVVSVVRKRAQVPVTVILVIDATTGQNGLQQAREFNQSLDIDGLIITKLDGTAKGGIALAISKELELPIYKIGVGEGIEDLQDFNPHRFASALIGDMKDAG